MRKKNKQITEAIEESGYDYSTREKREETAARLYSRAKNARTVVEQEWTLYNDYYNFCHRIHGDTKDFSEETGLTTACMPDAWIQVESQLTPDVPEPEFHGRDDDMDGNKARQREFAVRYICDNNRLSDMNTRNERRLLKLGDAFWKAYWDPGMRCGIHEGDIRIKDIPVEAIYPDPAIRGGTLQDGEYVDYVYTIHKMAFYRAYRRELKKLGITLEDLVSHEYEPVSGLFDMTTAIDDTDDTVQILEHWFRHPEETTDEKGNTIPAGAVGCSIQVGNREIRYIPNYWEKTCRQNQLFPFVHYWRIQDENRFWNKSELFPVIDLIDAADRKLAMCLANDAMMANDIILVEEGAMADGEEPDNTPGAIWHMKQNRLNGATRLGGLQSIANGATGIDWLRGQIERATRNYDTNNGRETDRVTTATGMAFLRQDANTQAEIKKNDRDDGFVRLYELLDWLALEFFDDDRLLFLGADPSKEREAETLRYNSDAFSATMPAIMDQSGKIVREEWTYFPKVDVTVTVGNGIAKSKEQTLNVLQSLMATPVTADNYKIMEAQLNLLDLPGKQEIIQDWRERFANPMPMMPTAGKMPDITPQGIPGTANLPLAGGVQTV